MVGKAKAPTKEQKIRMELIGQQYFGCIPCRLEDPYLHVDATVQHVTAGQKRLGHDHTYGACPWHHQAYPPIMAGPSLAHGLKPYQECYGSEALLIQLQDWLIEQYNWLPWPDRAMRLSVGRDLWERWVTLRADDPYYRSR